MPRRKNLEKPKQEIQVLPSFEEVKENRQEIINIVISDIDLDNTVGILNSSVASKVFLPLECYDRFKKRTPIQILDTLDIFKELTNKLNEAIKYVPTLQDFCSLLGISMATFNKYNNNDTSDYEEVIEQVKDFIGSYTLQGAMTGKIKEISAMFSLKSTLGYKDQQDIVVNNNNLNIPQRDTNEILNDYMARISQNKDTGKIEEKKIK